MNQKPNIKIPPTFISDVVKERGETGRKWLEALPSKIDKYCDQWDLTVDGDPMHGYLGLVLPVRRGSESFVLKVTWADEETKDEAASLRVWDGQGAVKLIEADIDKGVMLLEALDAHTTLSSVPVEEAVDVASGLLRRLAVPAPDGMLRLTSYAERLSQAMKERWDRLNQPFDKQFLEVAQKEVERLAPSAANLLINQDLHYDNVLSGTREKWLVIDPKVVAGDPEFGMAPLLWRRPECATDEIGLTKRFKQIVRVAKLNEDRAFGWTLVRTVDYWLWALDSGLTEDPKRCAVVTKWLLNSRQ